MYRRSEGKGSFFKRIIIFVFCSILINETYGKVELSSELIEVLQRKSNFKDPDNRIIVAFKTAADPSEICSLKLSHESFKTEEYRAALGTLVVSEMNAENWNLEQILLEFVEEEQIVRRLPIGNTFILEGLDMQQANNISQLDRTVLLALSQYTLDTTTKSTKFKETFTDIYHWNSTNFDHAHKSAQINSPWNIQNTKSQLAWSQGFKGKGIVYGVIDTGVSYKHPILANNYAGKRPNGTFDHNYAWFDAVRKEPRITQSDRSREEKLAEMEEDMVLFLDQSYQEFEENGFNCENAGNDKESMAAHCKKHKTTEDGYEADVSSDDGVAGCDDYSCYKSSHLKTDTNSNNVALVVDKCGFGTSEPCDAVGHGTHVASTAIGGFGYGMAPEASWMACRSLSTNMGREEDSLACYNFFLAPHDVNGQNPRPELRPHVIGNSYGWESWAEVTGAGIDLAVRRLEAAGTVMVFAAGNSGPGCGTIHSAFSFTVGAITETGAIAPFSSRGPWTISSSWAHRPINIRRPVQVKPDISAPGNLIIGAIGSQHLTKMSGTSMAAPHVSGSVTLLRNPPSFICI